MAKTYYTKCGREFKKSSTATVTGYHIPEDDKKCADCPFQIEVKKGYPPVFERWECRSGSQPPNQTDDWLGSLEDKRTISIRSLHNDFLEAIMEYCKAQPDLSANYNQDLEDCRRVITVLCSPNKKGIAAKKVLVEKFFPPEDIMKCSECGYKGRSFDICPQCGKADLSENTCENCDYAQECDSVNFLMCTEQEKNKRVKKKQSACDNYIPVQDLVDDEIEGDLEDQLEELLEEEKTIRILTETRFINGKRVQHCCNTEPNGGSCKHKGAWQEGGGTTSPDHTYIYCDLLHKKIFMEPAIPTQLDQKNHNITLIIPEGCPVIKDNPTEQESQTYIYRGLV